MSTVSYPASRARPSPLLAAILLAITPVARGSESVGELKFELGAMEIALGKPLVDLGIRYEEALQKLWEASGREGALDAVLASQKELKRFRERNPVEPIEVPEVRHLLDIYLKNKADLQKQQVLGKRDLYAAYITRLKDLEADFTRRGLLEEAIGAKKERETAERALAQIREKADALTGARLRGRFHFFVDDDAWIYLNGEMISHRHKKKPGITVSDIVDVKVGDRVFAHIQNMGGPHRFRLAFVAVDGKHTIQFKSGDFVDLFDVVRKSPDFTMEHLRHADRHPPVKLTRYPENPFGFENGSEWVWGNGGFCSLAAVVSARMIRAVPE